MTTAPLGSGVDAADLSQEIRPQDDLFRYVNQRWFDRTPIPADRSGYGSFELLMESAERAIREILEEARSAPEGTEARKCGDLYAGFLDSSRIEALGAEPLRAPLEAVSRVESVSQLLGTIGAFQRQGISGVYDLFVNNDPGDPDRYLVFFEQGGISLPDESYYREEHFATVRDAFVAHVRAMFELSGLDDAAARASRVFELEGAIAAQHWDNVESRDSVKTYNLVTWDAASAMFDDAVPSSSDVPARLEQWSSALGLAGAALSEVVLRQPSFTSGLAGLLDESRLEAWRDWLSWRVISANAPYLSSAFVEENFDFYGRTLNGAEVLRERWKRAVAFVEDAMGEAIGKIYVERHFPAEAKARMDALVGHLVEAYRQSIATLEWMSEPTRHRALEKLDAFRPKIGFPVRWRDYSQLEVDPSDLLANVRAASEFEFRRNMAKIGQPIDRDEWFMTPQMVNAYYNPGFNEIVFPASILQSPFFDVTREDAANFGGIGSVIGHEIGHAFDDQGSRYDATGRLADWWRESDRAAFEERTRSLIGQFDALVPRELPDRHVSGALTIGENIGDLGGVGIAWKAYLMSLNGAEPPVIDGLSAVERFFLTFALIWREKAHPEAIGRLIASDPHSPPEFRVNQIVRNVDEFYEAFDVGPSDAMWLDETQRVKIW